MGAIVTGGRGTPFAPSGMTKSGSNFGLSTSYATVTTWTADTTGYPGSSVSGNGLVVQNNQAGAKVACSVVGTAASAGGGTITARLKVGATVVVTGSPVSIPGFGGTNTIALDATVDVAAGDIVTLEALASSGASASIVTGASSWVRVTQS